MDRLLTGTEEEVGPHERLHRAGSRDRKGAPGKLFDGHAVRDHVLLRAPDLLRIPHSEEAEIADRPKGLARKDSGRVDLRGTRNDLLVHETPERVPDRALFF